MMEGISDSYWGMPSPSDGYSASASTPNAGVYASSSGGASAAPFDPMDHARLSPSALDPSAFSSNFIMPRFAASGNGPDFGFAVAEPESSYRGAPKSIGMDFENNGLGAFTNFGYSDDSAAPPTSQGPSSSRQAPSPSVAPSQYKCDGAVYAPYGSSVVAVNPKVHSAYKLAPMSLPHSTPPTSVFDPVALGVPAPPETSTNFAGLYSSSGFDIIGVLARVAARPHQAIQIGPVDLSCAFLVVDAKRFDMPIVFASETFTALTGYRNDEIIGRNCRFLQSPDGITTQGTPRKYTDSHAAWHMRKHITTGKESQSSLINYRKSGEAFINLVTIVPITWDSDEIAYYVGFQVDLVDQPNAILARMKDGSYTVNYSLLNNVPPSVSMLSVESGAESGGESWAPVVEDKVVIPAAISTYTPAAPAPMHVPIPVESDDMDEEALLDIIASEGIAGLGNEDERKQFNKLLLDNSNDFIHVLSLKGSILYCSPSASKILEYEPSELVGTLIQGLCHPSDVVPVVRELKDSGSISHAKVNLLYRIQRKNSGYIWIEAAGKLHVEPGKGRKCVILIGRPREIFKLSWDDIRKEGGLADTEFWTKLSQEGMILTATSSVQTVTGFLPTEIVGTSIFQLVKPEAEARIKNAMKRCLAGEGATVEYQMKGGKGTLDVVTHFYPRQVKAFEDDMAMDAEIGGAPHMTIIAQTTERASHRRKLQQAAFNVAPTYTAGPNASLEIASPMSEGSSSSDNGTPAGPPPFVSTFKSLSHPSASSDNLFDELDTTRCTSWQYELHQLQLSNKRLRDEKDHLIATSRKKRASFASSLQARGDSISSTGAKSTHRASESGSKVSSSRGRSCANCGRQDSPEWRAGPTGLKSLCNACGLRWSKTQKAPIASGGESGSGSNSPSFSYEEAPSPANW